jgi:hypothetical protein
MKRSEMIKLIWDYVQSVEYDYNRYMDESHCEELLRKIESAGMKPLGYRNNIPSDEGLSFSTAWYHSGWESEDET